MARATDAQRRWAPPFFTIWAGQAASLFGSSLAGFALIWWLTQSTGSATVLATASIAGMLPGILLGPFAGAMVDRWNRRVIMIVADAFVAAVSAWLAIMFLTGAARPWHVYVIMLARSLGGAFHWPAMAASTSLMVPREHLSRVAGLNQSLNGAMNIVAPPIGALLLAVLPIHSIMGIDVATALIATVSLLFVAIPQPRAARAERQRTTVFRDVADGFRYVSAWRGLCLVLVMATTVNLLMAPAASLIPLLVSRHFGGGAVELGVMNSSWGLGIVAGGLLLTAWGGFRRRIVTTLTGLASMGLAFGAIAAVPARAFPAAVVLSALGGLANPITNGPLDAMLQANVAPEIQGRVFTLVGTFCQIAQPLGLAIAGPLTDLLGLRTWFAIGGLSCVVMSLVGFATPAVLNVEAGREGHRPASEPTGEAAS
mgnify:FL=1